MSGVVLLSVLILFIGVFWLTGFILKNTIFRNTEARWNHNELAASSSQGYNGRWAPDNIILRNALDLSQVKLREIMVPRTEIEAVPLNSTVDHLRNIFISTRFSRILVYQDTIDNISGYCEVKDIFRNPADISSSIRKLAVVPETMPASRLLRMFVAEKRNIALVVDEFGGTAGMITIEDLLEEIVGDIEDEHDTSDLVEKMIRPNEYVLSGRLEIDYLNEKYDLNLPESEDYATLAGMIMFYHGRIPVVNDIVRIGDFSIRILKVSKTRLELVNLKSDS